MVTPIQTDFGSSPLAEKLHSKLHSAHVQDAALDADGDSKVTAHEVFEYCLKNYNKYQKIISADLPVAPGWVLDDFNPKTSFDTKIRAQVQKVINIIDHQLTGNGVVKNSPEYHSKMAVALFYWLNAPTDFEEFGSTFSERVVELDEIGLSGFHIYLNLNGGLGVLSFKGDSPREASAIQALESKTGFCTEKSSILYSVFTMAGLSPFFAQLFWSDSKKALKASHDVTSASGIAQNHVLIGLDVGEKVRFFDPVFNRSDRPIGHHLKLDLVQYYAATMSNLVAECTERGDYKNAIKYGEIAVQLDPTAPTTIMNYAMALLFGKSSQDSMHYVKRALDMAPNEPLIYAIAGGYYAFKGDDATAEVVLKRAIQLEPDDATPHLNLGVVYSRAQKLQEAADEYERAIVLNPSLYLPHLNLLRIVYGLNKKKEDDIKCETLLRQLQMVRDQKGVAASQVFLNLGNFYLDQGRYMYAVYAFEQSLERNITGEIKSVQLVESVYAQRFTNDKSLLAMQKELDLPMPKIMSLFSAATVLWRSNYFNQAYDFIGDMGPLADALDNNVSESSRATLRALMVETLTKMPFGFRLRLATLKPFDKIAKALSINMDKMIWPD